MIPDPFSGPFFRAPQPPQTYYVAADNAPSWTPDVGLTDMLTVWRRLWIERDVMAGTPFFVPNDPLSMPNTVAVSIMTVTPSVPLLGGTVDVVWVSANLLNGEDAYEGGTLSIATMGLSLPIYQNTASGLIFDTITVPGGSFSPAQLALIAAGPVAATVTDDDFIPLDGKMHLPDGGALIISAFGDAYIKPIYVDPGTGSWNSRGTVDFVRHLNDDLGLIDDSRDLQSRELFWTTLLVGAFENEPATDADPDGMFPVALGVPVPTSDSRFDYGYSGLNGFDQNRSAIFLETIDDLFRQGGTSHPEYLIVTHEVGHTAGSGNPHRSTGIMYEDVVVGETLFDNESQRHFRVTTVW